MRLLLVFLLTLAFANLYQPYDPREDVLYRAYLLFTIIGVIGAVGGVIVLIYQTVATRRSADAAKNSADGLKAIERPWILLRHIDRWSLAVAGETQHHIAIRWVIKNFGKTPALVKKIEGHVDIVPLSYKFPEKPTYQNPCSTLYEEPFIPPGEESFAIINAMDRGWEQGELNKISRGELWFIFSGHVIYEDPFGELHESRFCLRSTKSETTPCTPVGPNGYNKYT